MSQLNMKKEYRAELKSLRKHRRDYLRQLKAFVTPKLSSARAILKAIERAEREARTDLARFNRRIAILEGRLS